MSSSQLTSWRSGVDNAMWDLIIYLSSVVTYILLFWLYKPNNSTAAECSEADAMQQRDFERKSSKGSNSGNRDRLDSLDSVSSRKSIKTRAQQKIFSLKRRKELVQRDIFSSLGLSPDENGFEAFCDKFSSFELVSKALVKAGFHPCDVVIGIDFTASNEWQGKRSFSHNCLHKTSGSRIFNPYQKVLHIIGQTLSFVSAHKLIHAFGFGDVNTQDKGIFPVALDVNSLDYQRIMQSYTKTAKSVKLSGPTNFAPIVTKAVEMCRATRQYHILILIVDGQVSKKCEQDTVDSLVLASNYPLSIIVIGVGDGPFGTMFEYDDGLPKRKFDNLQFVNFHRTVTKSKHEAAFALHALMEIPDQYRAVQQLGYIDDRAVQRLGYADSGHRNIAPSQVKKEL